jgi:hypothetical protein
MRQRMWLTLVGGILAGVALTTAQRLQPSPSVLGIGDTFTGNGLTIRTDSPLTIRANGVSYAVFADRMTFQNGEYKFEGNVRMKVEAPTRPTP